MADELAAEVLARSGWDGELPVPIEHVVESWGAWIERTYGMRQEGRCVPAFQGWVLQISWDRPLPRRRFTIAHEFAHWLVRNPERMPASGTAARAAFLSEEEFCDTVAGALLMPRAWLCKSAHIARPEFHRLDVIEWIARDAHVSREAAIIRLRDLFEWPAVLMCWVRRRGRWQFAGEYGVLPWEDFHYLPSTSVSDQLLQAASVPIEPILVHIQLEVGDHRSEAAVEVIVDGETAYGLVGVQVGGSIVPAVAA